MSADEQWRIRPIIDVTATLPASAARYCRGRSSGPRPTRRPTSGLNELQRRVGERVMELFANGACDASSAAVQLGGS